MTEQALQYTKDAGIARVLTRDDRKHAGMGIVISPRLILTCAHVLNVATGRPFAAAAPAPQGKIAVAFPFSDADVIVEGEVVVWRPMKPRLIADIALLKLDSDVPEEVGMAIFASVHRPLDGDLLNVFGAVSDDHVGNHVEAEFKGLTTVGQSQIDGTGAGAGIAIRPGFSGAAVWDTAQQSFVGMVRAINGASPQQVAYMVPTRVLQKAVPAMLIEDRRLPTTFSGLWTAYTSLFFLLMLAIFVWNRGPWATDQVSAFVGMNVFALAAPLVGIMWYRYGGDFKLHGWSTRIPRFGNFRADPGSNAEKYLWGASVFFLIVLPLYAQGHFLRTFYQQGDVFIYSSAFGYNDADLEKMNCPAGSTEHCVCWKNRSIHLCQHPDAGRFSTVAAASPGKGGFWDNYYQYGEKSVENVSMTFFPILQPVIVDVLTAITVLLYGGALYRTFYPYRRRAILAARALALPPVSAPPELT